MGRPDRGAVGWGDRLRFRHDLRHEASEPTDCLRLDNDPSVSRNLLWATHRDCGEPVSSGVASRCHWSRGSLLWSASRLHGRPDSTKADSVYARVVTKLTAKRFLCVRNLLLPRAIRSARH